MKEIKSFDDVINDMKGYLFDEDKKQLTPLGVIVCVSMFVQLVPWAIKVWLDSFKR